MGSFYSLHKDMATDTLVENDSGDWSPKALRHKRLLDLDPRSPSEGICRTPIVVDQTPKLDTRTACTPEPSTIDPRSPTNEFLRTPILPPCLSSEARIPARAGLNLDVSSPDCYNSSESGIESAEVSPEFKCQQISGTFHHHRSPDSALSRDEDGQSITAVSEKSSTVSLSGHCSSFLSELVSFGADGDSDKTDEEEDAYLHEKLPSGVDDVCLISRFQKSADIHSQDTPRSHDLLKCRAQVVGNKRLESLSLKSGVVRSPLSLVENSPRSTLPRQDGSISNKFNLPKTPVADKENHGYPSSLSIYD